MAARKIRFVDSLKIYTLASGKAVITSAVATSLLNQWDFDLSYTQTIGWTWVVIVGGPSLFAATDDLLRHLGKKSPTQVLSNSASGLGRKVPINYAGGRKSAVFLSTIANNLMLGGDRPVANPLTVEAPPEPIQTFTVIKDDTPHTIPVDRLQDFLSKSWQRQRQGKPALSRTYWMRQARPRMSRPAYDSYIELLVQTEGVIINRIPGRSGELAMPPRMTLKAIQAAY